MRLKYDLLGITLVALSCEAALVMTLRKREARELLFKEVAEFLAYLGVFTVFATFSGVLSPPETINAALNNVIETEQLLGTVHRRLFELTAGAAILYLVLTLYLGYAGDVDLATALAQYAVELDHFLGPLSQLTNTFGILWRVASHLFILLKISEATRPFFEFLLPSLLVPRLRRLTAPLVAFLFVVTAVIPYSLALLTPHVHPLPEALRLDNWGKIEVLVYDRTQMPVTGIVLVALRDDRGRMYVFRATHLTEIMLPARNYTALWVATYFTNFSEPACCYDWKPYVSCNCPIWPAKFQVSENTSNIVLVNLPVNLVYCDEGLGGLYAAWRDDAPLSGKSEECHVSIVAEPPKPVSVVARAGPYRLFFKNGTIPADNGTCWWATLISTNELPPGTVVDFEFLRKNHEYYNWWWQNVVNAVPEVLRDALAPRKKPSPKFLEYGFSLNFSRGACTAASPSAWAAALIEIRGICCWNSSHASPWNPFWSEYYDLAARLPLLISDIVRLSSILWNTVLLIIVWSGGLLAAFAITIEIIPSTTQSLFSRVWGRPFGANFFRHGIPSTERSAARARFTGRISGAGEKKFKRFAGKIARLLRSKPIPLALATASQITLRRGRGFARSKTGSKFLRTLHSLSLYPSRRHQVLTFKTIFDSVRLTKQLSREAWYRLLGYKVLLPYSLTAPEIEVEAIRRMANYLPVMQSLYTREVEKLGNALAAKLPEIRHTRGWELFWENLRYAGSPLGVDWALRLLLDAHPSARRIAAKITGVAPSPWMHRDLALELRIRILNELAAQGFSWARSMVNAYLWSEYESTDRWSKRARLFIRRMRRGIRCRLEAF